MAFKIPKASQDLLDKEQDLLNEMRKYDGEAWAALKHQRLEGARDGTASPEAITALAELAAVGREWDEKRDALYHALQGLREVGYITLRDEVILPGLLAKKIQRDEVIKEINAIMSKHPGAGISYDRSWQAGIELEIEDVKKRSRPISPHQELSMLVSSVLS